MLSNTLFLITPLILSFFKNFFNVLIVLVMTFSDV